MKGQGWSEDAVSSSGWPGQGEKFGKIKYLEERGDVDAHTFTTLAKCSFV